LAKVRERRGAMQRRIGPNRYEECEVADNA
jgi:hypothetical protein